MVAINRLVGLISDIAGKEIRLKHVVGPQGMRGRDPDNRLINEKLGWAPSASLRARHDSRAHHFCQSAALVGA
jgi:GDP-D-mannose 3', 5'-epimerase